MKRTNERKIMSMKEDMKSMNKEGMGRMKLYEEARSIKEESKEQNESMIMIAKIRSMESMKSIEISEYESIGCILYAILI